MDIDIDMDIDICIYIYIDMYIYVYPLIVHRNYTHSIPMSQRAALLIATAASVLMISGRDLRQKTQIDQFPSNERFPTDGSLKWMIYICIEIISEVFPSKSP